MRLTAVGYVRERSQDSMGILPRIAKQIPDGCREYSLIDIAMCRQIFSTDLHLHKMRTLFRHVRPWSLGAMFILVFICVVYWIQLLDSQRRQMVEAETQINLRATQMATTLAVQVETLFTGLEHLVHTLAVEYMGAPGHFARAVHAAFRIFPQGSIEQVVVVNQAGQLVYVSHDPTAGAYASISATDRDYFRVHADSKTSRLYVGAPIKGRLSGIWVIPLSYPLRSASGQFLGVVLLAVSPDYISGYFRQVFPTESDAAMLLLDNGTYLARSSMQAEALNLRTLPVRQLHARDPAQQSGAYRIHAAIDGVDRDYAWHRVANYPLFVSVGLDHERALASTLAAQHDSRLHSMGGTVLILLTALWIMLLFARQHRDHELLADSEERYKLALEGGGLDPWDWDIESGQVTLAPSWPAMLGYGPGEIAPTLDAFRSLIHPDDHERINAAIDAVIRGDTDVFAVEHRSRHRDGHWAWISAHARITRRASDGRPLRMTGIRSDISQRVADGLLRRALLDNTGAAIFLVTPERFIRFSNQRAIDIFSEDGRALDGQSMHVIHGAPSSHDAFQFLYTQIREGSGSIQTESALPTRSGEVRWFSIYGTLFDPSQPDGDVIWTMIDITDRRHTEEALRAARIHLTQVIEHFPGGILVEDRDGRVAVVNQTLCDLLAPESILATSLIGEDHTVLAQWLPQAMLEERQDSQSESLCTSEMHLADGRNLRTTRIPIGQDDEHIGRLWIVQDITEQYRQQQALERLAATDMLTGLANRRAFMAHLHAELARIARGGPGGMMIMLDLDHFKRVNDTYGHATGDAALVHLADLLLRVLRRGDVAARLGGEEFAILLPGTDAAGAKVLGERLRSLMENSRISTTQGALQVTMSMGIAALCGDADSTLAHADAALYRAKHSGRNRVEMAVESDAE